MSTDQTRQLIHDCAVLLAEYVTLKAQEQQRPVQQQSAGTIVNFNAPVTFVKQEPAIVEPRYKCNVCEYKSDNIREFNRHFDGSVTCWVCSNRNVKHNG